MATRRDLLRWLFLGGSASVWSPLAVGVQRNGWSGPLSAIPPMKSSTQLDGIRVPRGFVVRCVARSGHKPAPGRSEDVWHPNPDGGACFTLPPGDAAGPGWVYVSNSETGNGRGGVGALKLHYDRVSDMTDVVDAYRILQGTSVNCAGGATPWNTWLSCEEFDTGQVYECDPYTRSTDDARACPTLGLFKHEAACVDPDNKVIYLTEDTGDARFYRWLPGEGDWSGSRPALRRGRLQVLEIEGLEAGGYAGDPVELEQPRSVTWVDVVDPGRPQAEVRESLQVAPGTLMPGGEGLWFHRYPFAASMNAPSVGTRWVFFTTKYDNRVYALDVDQQRIQVIFDNRQIEPDFSDVDNLCVSPAGDIVVAEDRSKRSSSKAPLRLMIVRPNQPAKVLLEVDQPGSELTGPAFSPDGSRLYFSSQRGPQHAVAAGRDVHTAGQGATYELWLPPQYRRL